MSKRSRLMTGGIRPALRDAAAHITLNRPKKLNAMNALCIGEMRHALAAARRDDSVRVVILSGAGEVIGVIEADKGDRGAGKPGHRHSQRNHRRDRRELRNRRGARGAGGLTPGQVRDLLMSV